MMVWVQMISEIPVQGPYFQLPAYIIFRGVSYIAEWSRCPSKLLQISRVFCDDHRRCEKLGVQSINDRVKLAEAHDTCQGAQVLRKNMCQLEQPVNNLESKVVNTTRTKKTKKTKNWKLNKNEPFNSLKKKNIQICQTFSDSSS